jgi:hypothetical protein
MKKLLILQSILPILAEYGTGEQITALKDAIDLSKVHQPDAEQTLSTSNAALVTVKPLKINTDGKTVLSRFNFDPGEIFLDQMLIARQELDLKRKGTKREYFTDLAEIILNKYPETTKKLALGTMLLHCEMSNDYAMLIAQKTAFVQATENIPPDLLGFLGSMTGDKD